MKIIVVALFLAAVTVYAAPKDEYYSWDQCLAERNITNAEYQKLYEKLDPKVHCFIACAYEKEGILVDGKLNKDVVIELLMSITSVISVRELKKMYDSCLARTEDSTDICEITNILSDCIHNRLARAGV